MKYEDFERIFSQKRTERYLKATGGDKRKAMTLYRYNLCLSHEVFNVIHCFEVALRNAIDAKLVPVLGEEWLKDSVSKNGIFTSPKTTKSHEIIMKAYKKLDSSEKYSHSKLLSTLDFGMWKYMYSKTQYMLTKQTLLGVFPDKQRSTPQQHINQSYIFNELDKINSLRNRIAHHEPICFPSEKAEIYTDYIRNEYHKILTLFAWMGIDSESMLYGLDHVLKVCDKIDELK